MKRVSNNIKLLSIAKINLSRRKGNVDNSIKKIPKNLLSEEGLVYERIKWRRRAKLEKTSLDLLLKYKGKITQQKKWWVEVNYHSRKQISYGNYKAAINLLKNYNKNIGEFYFKSSWLIGWLSLTFEKDPKKQHMKTLQECLKTLRHLFQKLGLHFAGKSAEISGDNISAKMWYERAAAFPSTFLRAISNKEK